MFQCDCPPHDCAGCVKSHLGGDRTAGDRLVRKFTPLVSRIVQRVLGPQRRSEWEDACQAVFLRLFTSMGKWEKRCPFCKWLAVVAARRAIDFTRLAELPVGLPAEEVADPRPPTPAPAETIQCIQAAVAPLSAGTAPPV